MPSSWRWWPEVMLLAMICLFTGLAWASAQHVNTLWDEANDHQVAVSLLERPLVGSGIDATQARLPMYATAAAYAVAGPSIRVARAVSIAMGAAAIALTFVAGRRWFGTRTGLLAAALLAISPFFLTFARTGLTEGDAFCPAAVLLMLLAFDAYLQRRSSFCLALFAGALGLCLAVKFYTLFFVPALMLCDYVAARRQASKPAEIRPVHLEQPRPAGGRGLLVWAGAAFGSQMAAALLAQLGVRRGAAIFWLLGVLIMLAGVIEHFFIATAARRTARRWMGWNPPGDWLVAALLAAAVCGAVCPAHVLNPEIARALIRSLIHPVEPESMVRVVDPARLYLGILLIKLGPPLGVLTLAAIGWSCLQKDNLKLQILCSATVIYVLFLLILPLRQPFYLMSVYPLVVLMLAAFVGHVWQRLAGRERLASAWLALVVTSCLYLLWGTLWSYPEFGYYGYTLVGRNWLGAEARGYRNLIQVTNDGTEDALAWLDAHVPPGRRVVSYLWDDHVIDRFLAAHPPRFQLVRRHAYEARRVPPEIDDADFVVVALNNETSYRDLPPASLLEERFAAAACHLVRRGRGRLEMAVVQIFARAPANPSDLREISGPVE